MPLPLLALVLASPLLVTDIDATRSEGELRVQVTATGALSGGTAELQPGKLILTVPGASLSKWKESFHHHHRYIVAQRKWGGGVRIEVPVSTKVACTGAVELLPRPDGMVARAECGRGAAGSDDEEEEEEDAPAVKLAAAPPAPAVEAKPAAITAPAPVASPPLVAAPIAVEKTPAASGFVAKAPEVAPSSGSTSTALWLPALALLGLAGAAFYFGRRRAAEPRLLRVLESVSLGPKRALLLARVGSETLLLSTSEAGVTLIAQLPADKLLPAEPSAPQSGAGSLGASLRARASTLLQRQRPAEPAFDDLFAEAAEDQELRIKLAAGRAAQVQ